MRSLPEPEERQWLLDNLRTLVESRGPGNFLGGPIVLPNRHFFPDPWSFSKEGIDRVVRRLMQYAGLGDLDVEVRFFSEIGRTAEDSESAAAYFMGIEGRVCKFAIDDFRQREAEAVAGVMCHEVAHAYRHHHGLRGDDFDQEEYLTDLTTVYLGFGILAANNRLRVRTSGWSDGHYGYHRMSTDQLGYLPVQAFTYLLGAQWVAWNETFDSIVKYREYMESYQADLVEAAMASFPGGSSEVVSRICPNGALPAAERRLADILKPLPEYARASSDPVPAFRRTRRERNVGKPVFKVPADRAHSYVQRFGYSGPIWVIGAVFFGDGAVKYGFGVWLGLIVVAFLVGRSRKYRFCAETDCGWEIPDGSDFCPGCGGSVVGEIARQDDRLEALEEYEERHGIRPTIEDWHGSLEDEEERIRQGGCSSGLIP